MLGLWISRSRTPRRVTLVKTEPKKEAYETPRIVRVLLRPEEAVLGSCKTASTSGPIQGTCNTPINCNVQGS